MKFYFIDEAVPFTEEDYEKIRALLAHCPKVSFRDLGALISERNQQAFTEALQFAASMNTLQTMAGQSAEQVEEISQGLQRLAKAQEE